jgi:hypothetical protein
MAEQTVDSKTEPEVTLEYCNKLMEQYNEYKKVAEQHQFLQLFMWDARLIPAHKDLNKNWNPEHGAIFARSMRNIVFPRLGIKEET